MSDLIGKEVVVELGASALAAIIVRDGVLAALTAGPDATLALAGAGTLRLYGRTAFAGQLGPGPAGEPQLTLTAAWATGKLTDAVAGTHDFTDVHLTITTRIVDATAGGRFLVLLELVGSDVGLTARGDEAWLARLRRPLGDRLRADGFPGDPASGVAPGRRILLAERLGDAVNLILQRWLTASLATQLRPAIDGHPASLAVIAPMTIANHAGSATAPMLAPGPSTLRGPTGMTLRVSDELVLELGLHSTLLAVLAGLEESDLQLTGGQLALRTGRTPSISVSDSAGRVIGFVLDALGGGVTPELGALAFHLDADVRYVRAASALEPFLGWALAARARLDIVVAPALEGGRSLRFTVTTDTHDVAAWLTFWGYAAIAAITVASVAVAAVTGGAASAGTVAIVSGVAGIVAVALTAIIDGFAHLVLALSPIGVPATRSSGIAQGLPLPHDVVRFIGTVEPLALLPPGR